MSSPEWRTGPNSPDYYPDAADPVEAQLRADAAQWHYLREIAKTADTPEQSAKLNARAGELAVTWSRHDSLSRRIQWQRLRDTFAKWTNSPEQTARQMRELERAVAAGEAGVDQIGLRNLRQAGELTGRWEPGITGSEQDSAGWQPVSRAPSPTADASTERGAGTEPAPIVDSAPSPPSLLDRALGAPQRLLGLDEVAAIIAGTDQPRGAAEELEASEADSHAAVGDQSRTSPLAEEPTGTPQQQLSALQALQDHYAAHTRLAESFNDPTADVDGTNQMKVAALGQILADARAARVAAAQAGASIEVIRSVSLAGQSGTYWRERPGDPRQDPTAEPGRPEPGPTLVEHAPDPHGDGSPDPPAHPADASQGGIAIGHAIEAATTEDEPADWHAPDRSEVSPRTVSREAAPDLGC
ncbi:hypothetical protein ACFYV7_14985 [Nocardia suismassiliense]|uniref:Uncharacterized protein n=1 Tax=Nocardia suismassiliense TaxID=2077092 RepID=A0ABW6QS82_9NOCA